MGNNEEVRVKYHDNGTKLSETHYKNGQPDGMETHWYETGEKHWEKNWKNGRTSN